jgi:phosphoenolpyruvate---glycerone phosphotransferase subunit DhaL
VKDSITGSDVKAIFSEIRDVMVHNRAFLCELDGAMGDGDLGITMSEGYQSIVEGITDEEERNPGKIMLKAGAIMAGAVPSTMGTLMATAIMRAGKEAGDVIGITLEHAVQMGHAAVEGIKQRGKAQLGEKTILDALIPAVASLEQGVSENKPLSKAFEDSYATALAGVEATRQMKSVHGRAAWYGEKSIGSQDPGATACMLVFKGIVHFFDKIAENGEG